MTEQPSKPNLFPPNNKAVAALRAILWVLPASFTVLSLIVVIPGADYLGFSYIGTIVIWLMLSAVFTLATGWFNASLSSQALTESDGIRSRSVRFYFIQLILIPLILLIVFIVLWRFGPPLKLYCMISPPIL